MAELHRVRKTAACAAAISILIICAGCAKQVSFNALPMARGGAATAKVDLTYDRNNTLEVKLSNVPDPSSLKPEYTRYVLWAATPDRQQVINVGQLRMNGSNAQINTLTPLRSFVLFITAEPAGDVSAPGPDTIFEAARIDW
jgi:hypothetical protein